MIDICLLDVDDTITKYRECISDCEHEKFQSYLGEFYVNDHLIPKIGYEKFGNFINLNFKKVVFWTSVPIRKQIKIAELFGFKRYCSFGNMKSGIGISGLKHLYFEKLLDSGLVLESDSFLWIEDSLSPDSQQYIIDRKCIDSHVGISIDESLENLEDRIFRKLNESSRCTFSQLLNYDV